MRLLRRWRVGAAVLALLVGAVPAGLAATANGMPATAASTATTTYNDPAGDGQGGPDITTVTIDGDPATSTITVAVTVTGFLPATPDGAERDVCVWLDTDNNRWTGDPQDGTEFGLVAFNDSTGRFWNVERWNGTDWVSASQSATLGFTRVGDVLSWRMSTADLGGATGFRFYVVAGIWNVAADDWATEDDAPDDGWWDFSLAGTQPTPTPPAAPATKVTLRIAAPETTPRQVVAGKRLTVSFRVDFWREKTGTAIDVVTGETRSITEITWTPVPRGTMVCDPSVRGKVLVHSEALRAGNARLSFVVPKTAKGKLLTVKVRITATDSETGKTLTAGRVATFRVH